MSQSIIGIWIATAIVLLLPFSASAEKKSSSDQAPISIGPLTLGGYLQPRYRSAENTNDSFDVRRARLDLNAVLPSRFKLRLQAELAGNASRLLDAYFTYSPSEALQLTGGQFKLPFSRENLTSSSKLELINRSQVVEALVARSRDVIGNQNGRDIGLQVGGALWKDSIAYAVALINGNGINTTDQSDQKDVVARLVFQRGKNFYVGASHYHGRRAAADRIRTGGEAGFMRGPFAVRAEYIRGEDETIRTDGWYVQSSYNALQQRFQAVVRFDTFDADRQRDGDSSDVVTFGANLFFHPRSFLQINYEVWKESANQFVAQYTLQF